MTLALKLPLAGRRAVLAVVAAVLAVGVLAGAAVASAPFAADRAANPSAGSVATASPSPGTTTSPPASVSPSPTPTPSVNPTRTPAPTPAPTAAPTPSDIMPPEDVEVEDAPRVLPGLLPSFRTTGVSLTTLLLALAALGGSWLLLWLVIRNPADPVQHRPAEPGTEFEDPATVVDSMMVIGTAMIDCGYTVGLVEEALQDIGSANGLPMTEAVVLPTALVVSADRSGAALTRAGGAGRKTYRLHQIDGIDRAVRAARAGLGSASWARDTVVQLGSEPAPFSRAMRIGAYVFVSTGISVLLGASWLGVLLAAVVGAGVGLLLLLSEGLDRNYSALVTVGAALSVSLIAFLVARTSLDPGILPSLVAPLVILLPGGLLTTGVIELATGNIIAGAARIAAGAMRLLLLGVGIVAAAALVGIPTIELYGAASPLGPLAPWIAVAVFGVGIAVHQSARPETMGWILLVLYVAYGAQVIGDVFFGGVLSALIGAMVMTPVAIIVAKQRTGPSMIVSFLPAFWLLVPGALGLVGVTAILDGDDTGVSTIVTTISTMIAIALGVLIGLALSRIRMTSKAAPRAGGVSIGQE